MANVEVRIPAFVAAIEAVLRQRPCAGQVKEIGYFVNRVRPGIGGGELDAARETFIELRLKTVIDRIRICLKGGERTKEG